MRRIKKQAPPADLAKFVRRENPQKFEEIHHSQHFPNLYDECIDRLKNEQGNLSGYTEKPLKSGIHGSTLKIWYSDGRTLLLMNTKEILALTIRIRS